MNYKKCISIFSDIHIHPHGSSAEKMEDCLNCLEWIYSETYKKNIPYIIFAGDLFHDRHRINVFAYNKTYEILEKYSNKIKSYYLIGNHDMFYRSSTNINSLKPFSQIIEIIENPTTINFFNIPIDFLPYTENDQIKELKKFKNKSNIFVGHLSITGAILNALWGSRYKENDLMEDISEVPIKLLSGYQRAFLGHFHCKQKINKSVEYIGSPLQLSFGEAMDQKGFIIFDPETIESEFIENNFSPKYYILPQDVNFSEYNLENSYLKIISSRSSEIDQISVKEEIKNSFSPRSVEIIISSCNKDNIKINNQFNEIEDFSNKTKDIIKIFINSIETDLDKEKLIEIGNKITQTVEQEEIEY